MAPVDPKFTYFIAYLHETLAVKSRRSMKTLGHGNGTKIHKTWPLSTKIDVFHCIRAWHQGGENKT